jgi:hypothetical protein
MDLLLGKTSVRQIITEISVKLTHIVRVFKGKNMVS